MIQGEVWFKEADLGSSRLEILRKRMEDFDRDAAFEYAALAERLGKLTKQITPVLHMLGIWGALAGKDLSGVQAMGVDLSHSDLRGTNFDGAFLVRAEFVGADLRRASFKGANLNWAQLYQADGSDTSFEGAKLVGVSFLGGRFEGANFDKAWLTGSAYDDSFLRSIRGTPLGPTRSMDQERRGDPVWGDDPMRGRAPHVSPSFRDPSYQGQKIV